jgi:hypothetical protein
MFRVMLSVLTLLGAGLITSANADQPATNPTADPPDKRADSSVPPSGVIRPAPDASRDRMVTPPNVDPGMAVKPPGTPGGNPNVVPK